MLRNTGRPAASNSIESRSENAPCNRKMVPPKIARTEMRTRHLDAGLARSLALERTPTRNRAFFFCLSENQEKVFKTPRLETTH